MKSFTIFTAACVFALPVAAAAQSNDQSPFNGPFVGVEGSLDSNQVRKPTTPAKTPPATPGNTKKKKTKVKSPHDQGFGGRIFAGYDVVLGDSFLIGVEAGIGTSAGAMTLDPAGKKKKAPKKTKTKTKTAGSKKKKGKKELALAAGEYRLDPGLTYDATARIGFLPSPNFLVYGRGGYRWLNTEQSVGTTKAGKPVTTTTKVTEKGFTYGGGAEFAVSENFRLRAEFNRTNFSKNFKQNKFSVGATVRF